MSAMVLTPEADMARLMLAAFKIGHPVSGIVRKLTGDQTRALVDFHLPLLGDRAVFINNEHDLQAGEHIEIHARRDGDRYRFQVARA